MAQQYQYPGGGGGQQQTNQYVPPGENPLTSNPYAGQTGLQNDIYNELFQDFQNTFGRMPTQQEVTQLAPAYNSGDAHITNRGGGQSAVSQYYQGYAYSPAKIYSQQQSQWQQNAPQNYGTITQLVQSMFGRTPTQDELDHYGTLIASGQADAYQIGQFLQSTPEYQNAQDTQFRSGVDQQLQKSDTDFFNTQKGNIAQQYAQMGRATSPALDVALTQLASSLNSNRQSYLAQLSAQQYGGNKQAALQNYGNTQNQVQGQINQNTQGIYNQRQGLTDRVNNMTDYATQNQAWQQAMGQYGNRKPGWMDYLNTGLNAVKTGAKIYSAF